MQHSNAPIIWRLFVLHLAHPNVHVEDYFLDSDRQGSMDYLAEMQDAWSRLSSDLANYRSTTLDEQVLVKHLGNLLDRHWQYLNHA
jgi:hypothetical protein